MKKTLNYVLFAAFILLAFSIINTSSTDFSQDLGRHLKLGEIIITTHAVPQTNLFSYTNRDFPFINHHWLSEVIFYLTSFVFGLNSLNLLKFVVILFAIIIVYLLAIKRAGIIMASTVGLIFLPFFLERNNIRPEIFGYLFFALILHIVITAPKKVPIWLPFVMLFWINVHISFVFGILLICILFIKHLWIQKNKFQILNTVILSSSLLVLFLNPNGVKGMLYPLTIFKNYGYPIVENQNLLYLSQLVNNPLIKYFFILSPFICVSLLILLFSKKWKEFFILTVFFLLSWLQLRHWPFFILTAIPFVSLAVRSLINHLIKKTKIGADVKLFVLLSVIVVTVANSIWFMSNGYYRTFDINRRFGLGYEDAGHGAMRFIRNNKLPGAIFNNFDIGGYLIYELYPQHSVFVDNRPEAYPDSFMQNIYIRAQLDEKFGRELFNKYKINTIVFSHTDQTEWAQIFLNRIYKKLTWRLVYVDANVVVLTKDTRFYDIRSKRQYFETLISEEKNYINLFHLSRFFTTINRQEIANAAIDKAEELNPGSCTIIRHNYNHYLSNPSLFIYKAQDLKRNNWYCF